MQLFRKTLSQSKLLTNAPGIAVSCQITMSHYKHQEGFKYVSDSCPCTKVHTIKKSALFHSRIHLLTLALLCENIPPACPHLEQSCTATTQLLQLNLLRFFHRSIESYQAKRTLLRAQKEEDKQ